MCIRDSAQIALYLGLAVVKIVIAEGDEVIAAEVQKPCRDTVPVLSLIHI